jgi:aquaporin Z
VIAPGAVVMAMIYAWGPLSGAAHQPGGDLRLYRTRSVSPRWVVPYWLVQFAGPICAALFLQLMFGDVSAGGNYPISTPGGEWKSLVMETVPTAIILALIIPLTFGTDAGRPFWSWPALAVGAVALAVFARREARLAGSRSHGVAAR